MPTASPRPHTDGRHAYRRPVSRASVPATWVFAVVGGLLPLLLLALHAVGAYEGGDVLLVLGPLVAVAGALVGAVVGGLVHGAGRPRR